MYRDDTPDQKPHDPFGRLKVDDGSQSRFNEIADLYDLAGTVGVDADNDPDDVARIEILLDITDDLDLGESDGPTGYVGDRLIDAITNFQKRNDLPRNGVVGPGSPTLKALHGLTADQTPNIRSPRGGEPA